MDSGSEVWWRLEIATQEVNAALRVAHQTDPNHLARLVRARAAAASDVTRLARTAWETDAAAISVGQGLGIRYNPDRNGFDTFRLIPSSHLPWPPRAEGGGA
jgi:hypothetical protein